MGTLSQLDVINDMLGLLGEAAINSLDTDHPLVLTGLTRLDRANRREQARGWWFNTEKVTLTPDVNGEIIVTEDVLKLDPTDPTLPYVQRGNKLRTTVVESGSTPTAMPGPVEVRLVRLVPFDDLPACAQFLISYAAQLAFAANHDADTQKVDDANKAYRDARIECNAEHTRALDVNLLNRKGLAGTLQHIRGPAAHGRII